MTVVQRFGGAININVHFHTLIPDGVFTVEGDGPARFVRFPAPRTEDVEQILTRVIRRVRKAIPGPEELALIDDDRSPSFRRSR